MTLARYLPLVGLFAGGVLISLSAAAVDLRLGSFTAGVLLIAAVVDWRRP